jgi:hypothetical protein
MKSIMKSIYNLDEKKIIQFSFGKNVKNIKEQNIINHNIGNITIWEIENFINSEICSIIINDCYKSGFEKVVYREIERLICFDKTVVLTNMIETNLENWVEQLNDDNWEIPRGFGNNFIFWEKNKQKINQCLRINKYNSNTIKTHRDAQYTQSKTVKSNYTLLIYLNDEEIINGGDTEFIIPTKEYEFNGLTINQELKLIGNDYQSLKIKPKIGKAIIFPHFLLHGSTKLNGLKYVLRTDLICFGKLKEFYEIPKAINLKNYIYGNESYFSDEREELNVYNKYMYEFHDPNENNEKSGIDFIFDYNLESNYEIIDKSKNENMYNDYEKQIKKDVWLNLIDYKYIDFVMLIKIINKDHKEKNKVKNKENLIKSNYLPSKHVIQEYFKQMNSYFSEVVNYHKEINYDNVILKNEKNKNDLYKKELFNINDNLPKVLNILKKKHYLLRDRYNLNSCFSNDLENKIECLTKKLFRQAQLNELENKKLKESSDLYEIVLNLRVEPRKIKKYPSHLEILLKENTNFFNDDLTEKNNPENIDVIELESRSGEKYTFDFERKFLNTIDIIKICILFSVYTSVYEITDETIKHQISQIKKLLNLENDFIFRKQIIQNKNFNEYTFYNNYAKNDDCIYSNKSEVIEFETDLFGGDDSILTQETFFKKYSSEYSKYFLKKNVSINDFKTFDEIKNKPHPLFLCADLTNINHSIPFLNRCMSGNINCCDKIDDIDEKFYSNIQWNLVMDDFLLELVNIEKKSENVISGSVCITTNSGTFNHASCQSQYDTFDANFTVDVNNENFLKFYRTTWNIQWELENNKITIYLEPKVIM